MYHPQRLNTKNQMMLQILHFMRSVVLKECLQNACSCRVSNVLSRNILVLSRQRVSTQFSTRWRCSYLQQPLSSAHMLNNINIISLHELPLLAKFTYFVTKQTAREIFKNSLRCLPSYCTIADLIHESLVSF